MYYESSLASKVLFNYYKSANIKSIFANNSPTPKVDQTINIAKMIFKMG